MGTGDVGARQAHGVQGLAQIVVGGRQEPDQRVFPQDRIASQRVVRGYGHDVARGEFEPADRAGEQLFLPAQRAGLCIGHQIRFRRRRLEGSHDFVGVLEKEPLLRPSGWTMVCGCRCWSLGELAQFLQPHRAVHPAVGGVLKRPLRAIQTAQPLVHLAPAAQSQEMGADLNGIIGIGRQRVELDRLAIQDQGQVRLLLDEAQTVVLDLVDRAMALGNPLAGQLEVNAFPGANFKGQLFHLAGFAGRQSTATHSTLRNKSNKRLAFRIGLMTLFRIGNLASSFQLLDSMRHQFPFFGLHGGFVGLDEAVDALKHIGADQYLPLARRLAIAARAVDGRRR